MKNDTKRGKIDEQPRKLFEIKSDDRQDAFGDKVPQFPRLVGVLSNYICPKCHEIGSICEFEWQSISRERSFSNLFRYIYTISEMKCGKCGWKLTSVIDRKRKFRRFRGE